MNRVEDALIRRLDARHAFAKVLRGQNKRNRSILVNAWRDGSTFQEIGQRLGLSSARVGQIHAVAFAHVQAVLKERTLSATPLRGAPPGFDKAAFLEHMRRLIRCREEQREEEKQDTWRKELGVMGHFLRLATPAPPKPRQPVAPPTPPLAPRHTPLPFHYWVERELERGYIAPVQNVEPWFRPDHILTRDDVHQITLYAVSYFAAARRVRPLGADATVTTSINIGCARDADAIAGALYPLAISLPAAMRFAWIRVEVIHAQGVGLEVCFA